MSNYVLQKFKTAVNRLNQIDNWFWCKYTINPYQGCAHACVYCDGRSERYYVHEDFEETIIIKKDIEKKLDETIKKSRSFIPDVVAMGGVCDSYQPSEKIYRNTRKILETLYKYKFPVFIITKSALIVNQGRLLPESQNSLPSQYFEGSDLELIDAMGKKTWATVGFTITTTDEEISNVLEPNASKPSERLKAMQFIARNYPNIHTGIIYMPIIPFLENDEKLINDVLSKSKAHGAQFVIFSPGVTLRDKQGRFFLDKIRNVFPEAWNKIIKLYNFKINADNHRGNNYNDNSARSEAPQDYILRINKIIYDKCKELELPIRIPRFIPSDFRKYNYILAEKLLNRAYFNQIKGIRKIQSNILFKAGFFLQNLNNSSLALYKNGKLQNIKEFKALSQNIKSEIIDFLKLQKDVEEKNTLDSFL